MLSIPDNIKALLLRDDVPKNLRIKFANSTRADITNENIIAESLSFQESACNSSYIELGVADSSVLKFSCTNQSAFRGETISAFIELGNPAYQIPLGVFLVDECSLQNDLITRNVVAYSSSAVNSLPTGNDVQPNTYEAHRRLPTWYAASDYTSYLKKWVKMMFSSTIDPADVLSDQLIPTILAHSSSHATVGSTNITVSTEYGLCVFNHPNGNPKGVGGGYDATKLYAVTKDYNETEIRQRLQTLASQHLTASEQKALSGIIGTAGAARATSYRRTSSSANSYVSFKSFFDFSTAYLYPFISSIHNAVTSYAGYTLIGLPYEVSLSISKNGTEVYSTTISLSCVLKGVSGYSDADDTAVSFARTKVGTVYQTILPDDFSFSEIAKGYALSSGSFGLFDRTTGNLVFKTLGAGGTYSVDPSHTAKFECDEHRAMYTAVMAKYKVNGVDTEYTKYIVDSDDDDNTNIYEINNYLWSNGLVPESQIKAQVDSIASIVAGFSYTPCDITMLGAPHMEAGDLLEITLANGNVLTIPVLNRTLSGIHMLMDRIDIY